MTEAEFSRRALAAADRLAELVDEARALADEEITPALVRQILEELSMAVEELRVSEEELYVQGEQLAETHPAVDAERERYGRLFESASDAYLETDVRGRILEANMAASRLFGVPGRFLVNKVVATFIDEPDRGQVRTLLVDAASGLLPAGEVRLRVVPRDGQTVVAGITIGFDPDPRVEELRVRWLLRDLTARERAEEERRSLQHEVDLLVALSDVMRLTSSSDPLTVLSGVLEITCELVEGGTASVTTIESRGQLHTAVAADDVAARLADLQHETGAGPCVEAARHQRPTEVSRDELAERWPGLAEAVAAEGIVEVLGLPLLLEDVSHGSLNVYSRQPLSASTRRALRLLAGQASVGVANAELFQSASVLAQQLEIALETRLVIERAKGMLMALRKCDDDEAFDVLRQASQRTNRKLREVAAEFLDRAVRSSPPPPPRAGTATT